MASDVAWCALWVVVRIALHWAGPWFVRRRPPDEEVSWGVGVVVLTTLVDLALLWQAVVLVEHAAGRWS